MAIGMIRIGLFDGHDIVRAGLKHILAQHADIAIEAEGRTGREALVAVRQDRLDVCLVDFAMPDLSGIDVLRHARVIRPGMGVLVTSAGSEEECGLSVLKAGAGGFVSKGASSQQLVDAVRAVGRGRRYVSPRLAEMLAAGLNRDIELPRHLRLSEREMQVFIKLVAGRSIVDIARELWLSAKTVSTYRSRMLKKMEMASNADLTRYAVRHCLVP